MRFHPNGAFFTEQTPVNERGTVEKTGLAPALIVCSI